MQRPERFGPGHHRHGRASFSLMPGTAAITCSVSVFFAGLLYGMLAYHSGSILPGMLVHFLGDLAFTYFAALGGDWRLLIVS